MSGKTNNCPINMHLEYRTDCLTKSSSTLNMKLDSSKSKQKQFSYFKPMVLWCLMPFLTVIQLYRGYMESAANLL